MVYTWFGGFKAVVWTDVLQLSVYLAGGIGALLIAWSLAGGPGPALELARNAGKLKVIDPAIDFTQTYTLLGGLLGGALLVGRITRHRSPDRAAAAGHPIARATRAWRWSGPG